MLVWREGKHVLALCSHEDNMKSESPSQSVAGGRAGGASCSEGLREGGMASDARIWDWIMQRKEPRSLTDCLKAV